MSIEIGQNNRTAVKANPLLESRIDYQDKKWSNHKQDKKWPNHKQISRQMKVLIQLKLTLS